MAATKPTSPAWQPGKIGTEGTRIYWILDEGTGTTVADLSPEGNDGSFVGTPTWGTGDYGPQLGGFSTGDYVLALPEADWEPPIWIATLAINSDSENNGYTAALTSANNSSILGLNYNGGGANFLQFRVRNNANSSANIQASGLAAQNDGAPHVAMGVFGGDTDRRLYWDGTLVASSTSSAGAITTGSRAAIGVLRLASASNAFPGVVVAVLAGSGSVPDPGDLADDLLSGTFAAVRPDGGGPPPANPVPLLVHHLRSQGMC